MNSIPFHPVQTYYKTLKPLWGLWAKRSHFWDQFDPTFNKIWAKYQKKIPIRDQFDPVTEGDMAETLIQWGWDETQIIWDLFKPTKLP